MALPDFFVIGAPKAGTTALHAALARHPAAVPLAGEGAEVLPRATALPPAHVHGPGDAHSAQEWVWQRDRYEALFDGAPAGTLRGESTAVLPVRPGGARADPRRWSPTRSSSRCARPDRPGLLQLDAPLVRRPRADRRLRGRLRRRVRSHHRGLGAVLALPPARPLRRAARAPPHAVPPRAGARGALPRARRPSDQIAHRDHHVPRDRPAASDRGARREHPPLRAARPEDAGHRAGRAPRRGGRPPLPTGRCGDGPARRCSGHCTRTEPRVHRFPHTARRVLVDYYADDIRRLSAITGDDYTDWLGEQGRGDYSARIASPVT